MSGMNEREAAARREQIVQAASTVFAREGYGRASIRKIAAEAALSSPALVYQHFENKAALFRAALSHASLLRGAIESPDQLLELPPREALLTLARGFIRSFEDPPSRRLFRVLVTESAGNPDVSAFFDQTIITPVMAFLLTYFARQIEIGTIRRHDPEASARGFIGMLALYVLSGELFPGRAGLRPEPVDYVGEIVDGFIHGLEPA
jgi:TetR/AcrR family transcriptional repressor of mexJK operon